MGDNQGQSVLLVRFKDLEGPKGFVMIVPTSVASDPVVDKVVTELIAKSNHVNIISQLA